MSRHLSSILLLAGVLGLSSCDRDTIAPPDRTPPTLNITSPSAAGYDDTSDGLVDVRVTWADTSHVDLESVRVRSLRKVSDIAEVGENLLDYWHVERLDSTGLVLHERKEYLLPHGENRLEVTVVDANGNFVVDTIALRLPYAELTKRLITGVPDNLGSGIFTATHCSDDGRIYMPLSSHIMAIDPDSATFGTFPTAPFGSGYHTLCVPGDPFLYTNGNLIERFNLETHAFGAGIQGSFASTVMLHSRLDPDRIYVGERYTGGIALLSRSQRRRTGEVPIPWSVSSHEWITSIVATPFDRKLYVARQNEGAILVVDPQYGTVLKRIRLVSGTLDYAATDLALSADGRTLYASYAGDGTGIAYVDTRTDEVVLQLPLGARPQHIELSPDERRMFVTAGSRGSANYLIDVINWQVLEEFPLPRPEGTFMYDGATAFHSRPLVFRWTQS